MLELEAFVPRVSLFPLPVISPIITNVMPLNDLNFKFLSKDDSHDYLKLRQCSEIEFPELVGLSVERELLRGESGITSLIENYRSQCIFILGCFCKNLLVGVVGLTRKISPKYFKRVPSDPYDGLPQRYSKERMIVYSLGDDFTDNKESVFPFGSEVSYDG